ncbi:hypothetical protein NPIL_138161 [Nephila pilipes]|uniref:Uncharacterized protein n=1 Tax=Nephila pilipes TaxID=299642 RepID=A0A8X6PIY6_NEPPI|nr:hypothetical protein NPIL_138161 [Nephila pilipes]
MGRYRCTIMLSGQFFPLAFKIERKFRLKILMMLTKIYLPDSRVWTLVDADILVLIFTRTLMKPLKWNDQVFHNIQSRCADITQMILVTERTSEISMNPKTFSQVMKEQSERDLESMPLYPSLTASINY